MGPHGRARWAVLGYVTSLMLAGCGSSTPTVVVNEATVTPGIEDFGAALQERLTTLHTCVNGSQGLDRQASSICYDGFAYTLDGVPWPANSTPDVASM